MTGTNGKTTTVQMLAAMLVAAGHRAIAAGNVGTSVVDAVAEPDPYEVLAVELSSFQLHWSASLRPLAAVVLNIAGHHLDWHGDIESYARDKGRIYAPGTDRRLQRRRPAVGSAGPGRGRCGPGRAVQPRAARPGRARRRRRRAGRPGLRRRCRAGRGRRRPPGRAAQRRRRAGRRRAGPGLRRARPGAVRGGLAAFRPEPHRISLVGRIGAVDYVDDSKATNPHAAAASLAAYPSVVWIAGGLCRGAAPNSTSWSSRRPRGCAASCCSALTGTDSARPWRDTRRMSRS